MTGDQNQACRGQRDSVYNTGKQNSGLPSPGRTDKGLIC